MGTSLSRYEDFSKNTVIEKFCGKESMPRKDSFWNTFLSYNMKPPLTRNDQIELDSSLDSNLQQLLANNPTTENIRALIGVTLDFVQELYPIQREYAEKAVTVWKTYNGLFAIRCILKYLIETVGEDEMIRHVEMDKSNPVNIDDLVIPTTLNFLFNELVKILVNLPVSDTTYLIHLEAVNCLLIMLAVQLFSQTQAEYSTVYRMVMDRQQTMIAPLLVATLLNNFVKQINTPPGLLAPHPGSSIVFSIAAGLWNVITLGIGNSQKNTTNVGVNIEDLDKKRDTETALASQSLLLLLVLTNHCTASRNPYRDALFSFTNVLVQSPETTAEDFNSMLQSGTFRFNIDKLFKTICKLPNSDEVTLLLYMLLHRNPNFKQEVMKRGDLHLLVIPILQILYHAPENTSHHIYMSLIILLILSEDETFNKGVHDVTLKGVSWYTERSISEISLGGLLILVVIRTIQYNMLKMRDRYLHTNCLAALANMSSQFRSLHPYVSQRIISLFETLAKKHSKLELKIRTQTLTSTSVNVNGTFSNTDLVQDLAVLEEVLRMVLEIINSCLTHQLANNPNLVYTLLYKRDVFQSFRMHPAFLDIIQNIDLVINFFSYKLEQMDQSQMGVTLVLSAIQEGTTQWPNDRLKKFPELKFKYVEEEQPEEFFIPYVWSIVCQNALIHWSAENIKLFLPSQNEQTTVVVC